jgi:sugar O-acyltransferase (sialic acid O-acetyltransferase NeuD family)
MNIVIVGAGGHGRVVLDILQYDRRLKLVGFIDDDKNSHGKIIDGFSVLGGMRAMSSLIRAQELEGAIVAVGDNKVRAGLFHKLKGMGLKIENAIHPGALIARDVEFGDGVVVASGAIINTGTKIGDDVIINTGVIIDHENIIEEHVHISPGVALGGNVRVQKYSHVGLGVTIVSRINIGENVTVGGGAVVLQDLPDNTIAVGVPARIIKRKDDSL